LKGAILFNQVAVVLNHAKGKLFCNRAGTSAKPYWQPAASEMALALLL
jgi:hypothetical protein